MCYTLSADFTLTLFERHGASIEEMTIEVNKAKANLDNADRDIRSLSALNNVSPFPPGARSNAHSHIS